MLEMLAINNSSADYEDNLELLVPLADLVEGELLGELLGLFEGEVLGDLLGDLLGLFEGIGVTGIAVACGSSAKVEGRVRREQCDDCIQQTGSGCTYHVKEASDDSYEEEGGEVRRRLHGWLVRR